jgi:hypothetical protein
MRTLKKNDLRKLKEQGFSVTLLRSYAAVGTLSFSETDLNLVFGVSTTVEDKQVDTATLTIAETKVEIEPESNTAKEQDTVIDGGISDLEIPEMPTFRKRRNVKVANKKATKNSKKD